jgi:HEAT repeat protein
MGDAPSSRLAMNKIPLFLLTFVGCFLLGARVRAQAPSPFVSPPRGGESGRSSDSNGSTDKPAEVLRSSQSETILRAGKDLGHVEVGRRVGAAKLLGKYPGSQSAFLLVDALDDKSPLVRRSVMVSLAEHASNGYPLYDKSLVEKVYSKLGDSDVEVRREVSTMIPRLVSGMRRSGVEVVEINGRRIFRSVPPSIRADLLQITQKAFLDPDAIVRQNVLKYHIYLGVPLPVATLVKLLGDSDLGVLLTALDRITSNAGHPEVVDRIEELSRHPDRGIRLKIVSVARDANRFHARYRSVLRAMTNDQDPQVLSMAAVELARFGERIPSATVQRIKQYLLGVEGMSTQVTTILYAISAMGSDGIGVYAALTEHSSSRIRKVSWQRYLSLSSGWNKPRLWIPATKDRDKGVREAVLNLVRGRPVDLSSDDMASLVDSKYADVRIFAGQSLLTVNKSVLGQFSFDLLIDENSIVRSTTIRAMGSRKVTGWVKVMTRSLLDDDYVIQQAAMEALLGDRARGVPALREFISKNPQNRISSLAQTELRGMGIQP